MTTKLVWPVIDTAWLVRNHACAAGLNLFHRVFGRSARVQPTRKMLRKAAAGGLELSWLAEKLRECDRPDGVSVLFINELDDAEQTRGDVWLKKCRRTSDRLQDLVDQLAVLVEDLDGALRRNYNSAERLLYARDLLALMKKHAPRLESDLILMQKMHDQHVAPGDLAAADRIADALGLK